MNPLKYSPKQLKKVGVFLATSASEAVTLGLLDGTAEKIVLCILAGLGTFGVFAVRNANA